MPLKIWTAQFRYKGSDRLDITIKTKQNPWFVPSWDMVMGYKSGSMTEEEYTDKYISIMEKSHILNKDIWDELLSMNEITLVCFCAAGSFCHRYILAKLLVKFGAIYMGERKV